METTYRPAAPASDSKRIGPVLMMCVCDYFVINIVCNVCAHKCLYFRHSLIGRVALIWSSHLNGYSLSYLILGTGLACLYLGPVSIGVSQLSVPVEVVGPLCAGKVGEVTRIDAIIKRVELGVMLLN